MSDLPKWASNLIIAIISTASVILFAIMIIENAKRKFETIPNEPEPVVHIVEICDKEDPEDCYIIKIPDTMLKDLACKPPRDKGNNMAPIWFLLGLTAGR